MEHDVHVLYSPGSSLKPLGRTVNVNYISIKLLIFFLFKAHTAVLLRKALVFCGRLSGDNQAWVVTWGLETALVEDTGKQCGS